MFDAFLKVDGVPGESTDDKHKDWIELIGWSHELMQPASATASSSGGAGTERVDHKDFSVTKLMDKASPKLYEACCTGKHLKEVSLEVCRAGGDKVKYFEVKMSNVIVSRVAPVASTKGDAAFPAEQVDFNYGKIVWTYTQQKRADGSGGGAVTGGWDLQTNKVAS
jgi:type VI secretion system secreted protein Hcp